MECTFNILYSCIGISWNLLFFQWNLFRGNHPIVNNDSSIIAREFVFRSWNNSGVLYLTEENMHFCPFSQGGEIISSPLKEIAHVERINKWWMPFRQGLKITSKENEVHTYYLDQWNARKLETTFESRL